MTKIQRLVIYTFTLVAGFATAAICYFTPNYQATSSLLRAEISFPELKETPLNEAISITEARIRQAHPRLKLFRIFHVIDTKRDKEDKRDTERLFGPDKFASAGITMSEMICPADEYLRYISELANCQIWYDAGSVHFVHPSSVSFGNHPRLGWLKRYILPPSSEK